MYSMHVALSFVFAVASLTVDAEEAGTSAKAAIDTFIKRQAKAIGGEESDGRQTSKLFDFDGLREPDVAVLYWISKDNDATAYLAVFESTGKTWSMTHQIRLGGRGLRQITNASFLDRCVSIECLEFSGQEPLSSPSLPVTITATVQNGLLDIKRTEQKD